MQKVINFSGGKTSAYMTIMEYRPGDIVLFCDTGREHPKTYKFINDFEAHEGIPVIRVSYPGGFDGYLAKFNHKRIPNSRKRICTIELKVRTAKRYLKSIGIKTFINVIGFRADEGRRVNNYVPRFKKVHTIFPLYHQGVTNEDINNFWAGKPYNLEIPSILGNCTLCFMKGKNAVISIIQHDPSLADPWIYDEEQSAKMYGHTYFKDVTIQQLKDIALSLKKPYDLNGMVPAMNCACTT